MYIYITKTKYFGYYHLATLNYTAYQNKLHI